MSAALLLILLAQEETPTAEPMSEAQLEQLVAPIALYPDDLITQILMASTYPLEIVQADRWAKEHKNLKGDALAKELEKQGWDASVKSLVNFPQVLTAMSEKLDVTVELGNAVLSQQKEVLAAIQRLRGKAKDEGNLETTEQQKVIVEEGSTTEQTIITIEPSNPEVIYVPSYNPSVVYGAWPYAAYPPYSYYPGAAIAGAALTFTAGMALGAAWGYAWGGARWGHGDIDINTNRNVNRNTNINRSSYGARGGGRQWQHDASHRRGVSYRDNATAQRFGRGRDARAAQSREAFRGRSQSGGLSQRSSSFGGGRSSQRSNAFSGVGGGGDRVRQQSSRGNFSRGGGSFGGGGGRSFGGGRGGRR